MSKSRDIFNQAVLPRLIDGYPDGVVSRADLSAEFSRAGIPFQYWLTNKSAGHGLYNISEHYKGATALAANDPLPTVAAGDTRTPEEIIKEIKERFAAVTRMAEGVAEGKFRAMLVSGNPGIGKTFTLEDCFERIASDVSITYQKVTGFVKATGLFRLFFENKEPNNVIMFDDCDSIFADEVALNFLKAACDSTRKRWISWRSEKQFADTSGSADVDDLGNIPKEFEFKGHVCFVTNLDFDKLIRANNRIAPHLEALVSRAFYLDLNLNSTRELFVRIKDVVTSTDMLVDLSESAKETILQYMEDNVTRIREISLRMVLKLSQIYKSSKNNEDFKVMALASCLKR